MIKTYPNILEPAFCEEVLRVDALGEDGEAKVQDTAFISKTSYPQDKVYVVRKNYPGQVQDCFYTQNKEISDRILGRLQVPLIDYLTEIKLAIPAQAFSLYEMSVIDNSQGLVEHADNAILNTDKGMYVVPFIFVVFLNDIQEGGQLIFQNQGMLISPNKGSVCVFPAHYSYRHAVLPTTEKRSVIRIELFLNKDYWSRL